MSKIDTDLVLQKRWFGQVPQIIRGSLPENVDQRLRDLVICSRWAECPVQIHADGDWHRVGEWEIMRRRADDVDNIYARRASKGENHV